MKDIKPVIVDVNPNPLDVLTPQNPTATDNSYIPASESCRSVDTMVPDGMRYDMHKAIETVDRRVNGVDEYVAEKLGYFTGQCNGEQRKDGLKCLCAAFSAEQVDALAVAIFNIEEKGQGCIIGDQTGIGKGRIAAGMIRYGIKRGLQPIFLTEKPNLFSDLFRDIINIGSDDDIPEQIFTGYDVVTRKATVSAAEEGEEADVEEGTEEGFEEEETMEVRVPRYKKNAEYPKYTSEVLDKQGNGTGKFATKTGKEFCKPFILNGRSEKTDVKDEQGHILYRGNTELNKSVIGQKRKTENKIGVTKAGNARFAMVEEAGNGIVPKEYKFILATYSQFNSEKITLKMQFLQRAAEGNIVVMDESHNASGASNIGVFLKGVLKSTLGVTFLSATFAKRPDNMPIYASKTGMVDANMTDEQMVGAIQSGGPALQEIVSSALVAEGQMIRRARSFDNIEVNWKYLDATQELVGRQNLNKEQEHRAAMDKATDIIRSIMSFQEVHVNPVIGAMDRIAKAEYKSTEKRKGTSGAGVDNQPIFSGIFNIINQLLFSLKAEAVAEVAIERIKEGKKPVISFANTMESFLDTMQDDEGNPVGEGEFISSDFSKIFEKRLKSVLRYTEKDEKGVATPKMIDIAEQDQFFQAEYFKILKKIKTAAIGISSSPIDVLIHTIQSAGYSVIEVTGRGKQLKMHADGRAQIQNRMKTSANDAFRQFNHNEIDCLMINQTGSTGASAHAKPNEKVPAEKVKQRVMILLQAELNVNTQVQKMGRINRTGQILPPIYDYVISAIPAERRLMMMLQKKLKSLDANANSNQKESNSVTDSGEVDFLNKYGDLVVVQYLLEYPLINKTIGDPLKLQDMEEDKKSQHIVDAAHKVSGRIAILPVKDQESFYNEMAERYISLVQYLRQTGEYDLEVENMNLEAETIEKMVVIAGKGGDSMFGRNSILEKCTVNNLRKPFKKDELDNLLKESLGTYTPESLKQSTIHKFEHWTKNKLEEDLQNEDEYWDNLKKEVKSGAGTIAKGQTVQERLTELEDAKGDAKELLREKSGNKTSTIAKLFQFFTVGKVIGYPGVTYAQDNHYDKGVFLGFDIKDGIKNPYAPSALKLRFAIAGSQKYVAVPASKWEIVNTIIATTYANIFPEEQKQIIERWDEIIKEKSGTKTTRYIVTGNILQAYSDEKLKGALISYTTSTGGVKKGILLPESWSKEARGGDNKELRITVPLIKALPILKDLMIGAQMTTTDNFTFISKADEFRLIVPISKNIGGKFYTDAVIMSLTKEKMFNSASGNMVATIERRKIENLVEYMQGQFNSSVALLQIQFERIKDSIKIEEYGDEEKKPESAVFVEKLSSGDNDEAAKRAQALAEEEFNSHQQAHASENAENETNALLARKIRIIKKLHNLRRLLQGKAAEGFAAGGRVSTAGTPSPLGRDGVGPETSDSDLLNAKNLGRLACLEGRDRVPARDKEMIKMIENNHGPVGSSTPLLTAWLNGWDKERSREMKEQGM